MPVRFYREEDLTRIYEIEKLAHGNDGAPDHIIKSAIDDGDCLVFSYDDFDGGATHIEGFLIVQEKEISTKKLIDSEYTYDELPYVWDIAVNPEFHGNGWGTLLLKSFENIFCKDSNQAWLLVSSENRAYNLYHSLGYRANGFVRDYYREGQHAIIMVKDKTVAKK